MDYLTDPALYFKALFHSFEGEKYTITTKAMLFENQNPQEQSLIQLFNLLQLPPFETKKLSEQDAYALVEQYSSYYESNAHEIKIMDDKATSDLRNSAFWMTVELFLGGKPESIEEIIFTTPNPNHQRLWSFCFDISAQGKHLFVWAEGLKS